MAILCVVIHVALLIQVTTCKTFTVNNRFKDTKDCLEAEKTVPCRSLEYIASNTALKNNITITITSDTIHMSSMAIFSDINNIRIEGQHHNVTILCNKTALSEEGLLFDNCTNINIKRLKLVNCSGASNVSGSKHFYSILVSMSKTLLISDITVTGSYGYGLITVNLVEQVSIRKSNFSNNGCWNNNLISGCGGVMIMNSQLNMTINTTYEIFQTGFFQNNGKSPKKLFGLGGGLRIANINSSNIKISIKQSNFSNNVANWGGAFHFWNKENSAKNYLTVEQCFFRNNTAIMGGGGCDVSMRNNADTPPYNNTVEFLNCSWINNNGTQLGGGMVLFTVFTKLQIKHMCIARNTVRFHKCIFNNNTAHNGAAIVISPMFLADNPGRFSITRTTFISCHFVKNKATNLHTTGGYSQGGVVLAWDVWVWFKGNNTFDSNNGSGMIMTSATVIFENSTNVFRNNIASKGGAIYLQKHSFIETNGSNKLIFINNIAQYGGAIMASDITSIEFEYVDQCFVKQNDKSLTVFDFENNHATSKIGNDMFIFTLLPCIEQNNKENVSQIFQNDVIGKFNFSKSKQSVTTSPYKLVPKIDTCTCTSHRNQPCIHPIPGKEILLHIEQLDQLNQPIYEYFMLLLKLNKSRTNIELESDGIVPSNAFIILKGKPNATGVLTITSQRETTEPLFVNIVMSECYPGFVYVNKSNSCECSDSRKDIQYEGIPRCTHLDGDYALLQVGYWAGYISSNSNDEFVTSDCLPFLCFFFNSTFKNHTQFLRLVNNKKQLEKDICAKNRQGILCSQCSENTSVFYNSPSYSCKPDNDCNAGFGLFILSEIIPTTVLFLFILFFNINLTSGSVYTLIFYIQILDVFSIDGYGHLQFSEPVKLFVNFFQIMYGIANLRFFRIEGLSFCIWKGTRTLDVIYLKYAVTAYAILLILGTVALLKVYSLYMCIRLCKKCGRRNIRYSVVNSLSAFILICYYHMINTSIAIVYCVAIKMSGKQLVKKVVMLDGDIPCFSSDHLLHITIATFSFAIISIPPFLLVTEPLILKLNSKFNLKIRFSCLNKLRIIFKPFLDSFQGCFKNDCRIFAGLFFGYRIVLASILVLSPKINDQYNPAIIMLIIIILIHSIAKPFAIDWHNKLDIFLLLNLLTIIFLTDINVGSNVANEWPESNNLIASIQIILSLAPLLIAIVYIGSKIKKRYIHKFENRRRYDTQLDESCQETIFAKLDSPRTGNYEAL